MNDEELLTLYEWIDSIPLAEKKKYCKRLLRWGYDRRDNEALLS